MDRLRNFTDFDHAINELVAVHSECSRTLEEYLLTLLDTSRQFADRDAITLNEWHDLLLMSFVRPTLDFDDTWRVHYETLPCNQEDFSGFSVTLIRQVVDLREMDEHGILYDDQRFFGLNAPRESRWHNFTPFDYLECAVAGAFRDSFAVVPSVTWGELKDFLMCGQVYE